jgi:hypothetical protein
MVNLESNVFFKRRGGTDGEKVNKKFRYVHIKDFHLQNYGRKAWMWPKVLAPGYY